ncbi:MAG: GAF domain-containing sensor histidine kinase [Candidatus Zixiibacteriota bacterium]
MDRLKKELRKAERRDWQMWTLVLAVFLILSAFIVLVVFYSDIQQLYEEQIDAQMFNSLLLGFVALSLLFIAYVVIKEIAVKKLQRDLVEQRIAAQVLERRLTELQAVFEVVTLVNSEMVLSGILDTISSKALRTLGGDQSSLFLFDPQIGKLRCVSVWGPQSDLVKNAEVEIGKSVAGWVMQHGKPLHLGEDLNEDRFPDFIKKEKKIAHSLCVPLMVKNKAKGVLNISLFDSKRSFTEADLKLVSIFAENAAVSIEKAELYERLKKQTETLKNTIDELKATQNRLIQSEKIRALGNLAGGMSHDFNNILAAILGRTQLLLREVGEATISDHTKEKLLKWLKVVEQLTNDGAETVKRIQKFARTHQATSEREFARLDINSIVKEATEITKPKWKDEAELKGIRIEVDTEPGELSSPMGNPSELREVLTNMIFNSIDALPDGGRIRIATRMREDRVEIKVSDNGMGMIEEIKSRVFEPFFTTKNEKGNGLGLSVAYGIISRHNGEITVESEPGEGTTFTITLPASGATETEVKEGSEITSPAIL